MAVAQTRRTKGISQKVLAAKLRVSETRLCSIERGRSVGASDAVVRQISAALNCTDLELEALLQAAAYDRLMREVRRTFPSEHQVEMLSIALDAAQVLSVEDSKTVISGLRRLVKPRADWKSLASGKEVATA